MGNAPAIGSEARPDGHAVKRSNFCTGAYNSRGQPRGPGFLVQSIRNPSAIALPPGFESSIQRQERQQSKEAQKQTESNVRTKRERLAVRRQNSRQRAFMAFWEAMSPSEQDAFETEALEAADTMKKRLYLESSGKGGKVFEVYRQIVLMDQFERTHGLTAVTTQASSES